MNEPIRNPGAAQASALPFDTGGATASAVAPAARPYGYVIVDNRDKAVTTVWQPDQLDDALDCLRDFNRCHVDHHAPYRLFELREVPR